ncbi:hypothetical protein [Aminipila terrae]|uniref:Uncharacterized protein n=1 Tax=Aminipila terrae TaxID=2697030 RepID=A0A6P1MHC4_9FIRM|nr:hypothetical protein [Aminipila terrae]QHI73141.1 hypothetical protein Ami3637_12715 [Aminipila terrae]
MVKETQEYTLKYRDLTQQQIIQRIEELKNINYIQAKELYYKNYMPKEKKLNTFNREYIIDTTVDQKQKNKIRIVLLCTMLEDKKIEFYSLNSQNILTSAENHKWEETYTDTRIISPEKLKVKTRGSYIIPTRNNEKIYYNRINTTFEYEITLIEDGRG